MHHPCAGKETKRTEGYTDEMAEVIHAAHHEEALDVRATSALTAKSTETTATGELSPGESSLKHPLPQDNSEKHDHTLAVEVAQMFAPPPGHRPKNCPPGLWCSLATMTIHPKDPLVRCPQAIKAIDVERMDLEKMGTWDTAHPFEAENAARLYPDAHFARVFAIVGMISSTASRARRTTSGRGASSSPGTRSKQPRVTGQCSRSSATSPGRCQRAGHSSPSSTWPRPDPAAVGLRT